MSYSRQETYRAPQVQLATQPLEEQGQGMVALTRQDFVLAGILALIQAALFAGVLVMDVAIALMANAYLEIARVALSFFQICVGIYLLLFLKKYLNTRFDFHSANILIYILCVLTVVLALASFAATQAFSVALAANQAVFADISVLLVVLLLLLALMLPAGIAQFVLGMMLRSTRLQGMTAFAWCTLLAGACMASLLFYILSYPLSILASIVMALMFMRAADEVEPLSSQRVWQRGLE